jgi:hypothetical protein
MTNRYAMVLAATSGILLGAPACAQPNSPSPSSSMSAAGAAKHGCKGQNDCKGQGGCKAGKNGCKGLNDCKGQGGCKTA